MQSRAIMLLWVFLTLALCACGGDHQGPPDVTPANGSGRAVPLAAGQSSQPPLILNPAEELRDFAPDGLLRWSAGTGATFYELWVFEYQGSSGFVESSFSIDSRQFQFTKLQAGRTYYVKLYYRISGTWFDIPEFELRTTNQVAKPRIINPQEELEAFGPSGLLRWKAIAGADAYEVWIYRDAALTTVAETSGPLLITQYQIANLSAGIGYYAQIYGRVNGAWQVGGSLKLTITDQLDRARILNPQEELDVFAINGTLRWSAVSGATQYELWVFKDPNVSKIQEGSGTLNTRSFAPKTLQPDTVYYAQAFALVAGEWKVGSPVRFTTSSQVTPPRIVTPQEQLEAFGTTGTLNWTPVPGATGYEVWIYTDAALGVVAESGATTTSSYTINRLCFGGTYFVQVYANVNGAWKVGWATKLDVTQGTNAPSCTPPTPKVKLTVSANEVERGASVTLNWTSEFATTCTALEAWSGVKGTTGQETVTGLTQNSRFTLLCEGPSRGGLSQATVTVRNTAPVANAGSDQVTTAGAMVMLDGSASSDANGDSLAYFWVLALKPAFSLAALSSSTVVKPVFVADMAGTYVASLVVSDGLQNSSVATVRITVSAGGEGFQFLYGGPGYSVYLGCLNCPSNYSDSVCNDSGSYGSQFSSGGIWNSSGLYGSAYGMYGPWSMSAGSPPAIIGSNGLFYGYFTINSWNTNRTSIQAYVNTVNFFSSTADLRSTRLWACGSYGAPGQVAGIPGPVISLYGGPSGATYLGCLNCPKFNSNSICNTVGQYGSEVGFNAIWNDFGPYGGGLGFFSPWNTITSSSPALLDTNGMYYGHFTANSFKPGRTSDPRLLNVLNFRSAGASAAATRYLACGS